MNPRKLTIYFFLPLGLMAVLLAMYFSGIEILETIISMPYLEGVTRRPSRELGLVESLQNVFLAVGFVLALREALKADIPRFRLIFGAIAVTCFLVLGEEIDWGLNYYEYLAGVSTDDAAEIRNLHNIGNADRALKRIIDGAMVLAFVIAPIALRWVRNGLIRYLTPDPYFLLTMLTALIVSTTAHALDDRGLGVGLSSHISEFREVIIYYIGMIYIFDLGKRDPPEPVA